MEADFIRPAPLPYAGRLATRAPGEIDLVVVHCTELPDLETARTYGERIEYADSGTGNSGHFYIDRDGSVESWVGVERVAHHARAYNERSIGVELVNNGRWPDWLHSACQAMTEPYPEEQIAALLHLLEFLGKELPSLRWISGHEFLDLGRVQASNDPDVPVRRKMDPGPLFPWPRVLAACPMQMFRE